MGLLRSSLDEIHGASNEGKGHSCGTCHLCSDGCGLYNRREDDAGLTKSPKGVRAEDVPTRRRSHTGLEGYVRISEQRFIGVALRMSWKDARALSSISGEVY